mmetsp:Transcript_1167/g.4624  ORF Transcript_1167/g.4624 Transcript_1167/m.4624 type:complete len:216 (+) Transcript_1167:1600-2247(+)
MTRSMTMDIAMNTTIATCTSGIPAEKMSEYTTCAMNWPYRSESRNGGGVVSSFSSRCDLTLSVKYQRFKRQITTGVRSVNGNDPAFKITICANLLEKSEYQYPDMSGWPPLNRNGIPASASICAAMNSGKNAMFTTSAAIMYDAIASSFFVKLCGCSQYASWLHSSFRMRFITVDTATATPRYATDKSWSSQYSLQNAPKPSTSSLYAEKPFSLQ